MDEENESGRELGLLVPHLKFISKTPLLATESAGEFKKFSAALGKGLNTRNIVEDMLAIDVRALATETARLRRTKTNLIKMAFPDAIKRLLFDTLKLVDEDQAVRLAQNWSTDEAAQQQVKEILMMAQLDEYAIEAEAIRSLAPILSALDEMLASLEYRSLRALRTLSDWRLAF